MSIRSVLPLRSLGPLDSAAVKPLKVKGFKLEPQLNTNWCWAAVTLSVARLQGTVVVGSQCEIVEQKCKPCGDVGCNQPRGIVEAFALQKLSVVPGKKAPDIQAISPEIEANQPIVCTVLKESSVKDTLPHAVVITEVDEGDETIFVRDPAIGSQFQGKFDSNFEQTWFWDSFNNRCIDHYILKK